MWKDFLVTAPEVTRKRLLQGSVSRVEDRNRTGDLWNHNPAL